MLSTARKMEPKIASEEAARVLRAEGRVFIVDAGAGEYEAVRAVSCLVEPAEGDVVLVSVLADGACYVLAVLERETGEARLVLDGDLHVTLPAGRFVVAAAHGIDLVSDRDVGVLAGELNVHARAGSVLVESLSYLGTVVQASIEKAKVTAAVLDTSVERLTQRIKRAYRFVEQFEHVRAERLDYAAKTTMRLHAENALVTAEELVKVDGAQIHLG